MLIDIGSKLIHALLQVTNHVQPDFCTHVNISLTTIMNKFTSVSRKVLSNSNREATEQSAQSLHSLVKTAVRKSKTLTVHCGKLAAMVIAELTPADCSKQMLYCVCSVFCDKICDVECLSYHPNQQLLHTPCMLPSATVPSRQLYHYYY